LRVLDDFGLAMVDGPTGPADLAFADVLIKTFGMQVYFAVLMALANGASHRHLLSRHMEVFIRYAVIIDPSFLWRKGQKAKKCR
jgi:hypothetical protein